VCTILASSDSGIVDYDPFIFVGAVLWRYRPGDVAVHHPTCPTKHLKGLVVSEVNYELEQTRGPCP
jgi:hypothetical protein